MKAIVIGAGPNGLVAGATLAAAGADVIVLEHSANGSGGITSYEQPAGFRHDLCAAFLPLTRISPAFRALDLQGIDWVTPPTVMAHPFRDGTALTLERDLDATAAGLGPAGPAYRDFMARLLPHHQELMEAALTLPPPARPALAAVAGLRADLLRLAWRSLLPAGTLGLRWLGDARSAAWLAGSTAHSDLDPLSPGGGAFALTLKLLGHAVGWPFPRGGTETIAAALESRIRRDGGRVLRDATVSAIVTDGRGARGVRLAGGDSIEADVVIATTTARRFAELVPDGALPGGIRRRLSGWRHDLGTFKVDFALSAPVPWTAEPCRRAGTIHLGDTVPDFLESFRSGRDGRFPRQPALVIGQHSLWDDSRAPAGQHTLYSYARSPLRMDIGHEEGADRIEERIEAFAPGFRETVVARVIHGPDGIEAHNPAMVGGDLAGGSYQLQQQLFMRPHPRMCTTRTPIRGVYLAGASVHPGGAVHGMQGMRAARMALADA